MTKSALLLRLAVWAWIPFLLAEFTATHWPEPPGAVPKGQIPWDKVMHFSAFVIAGALAALALRTSGIKSRGVWFGVALALAIYSLFDEATQPIFGRDSEWLDWAADLLGMALGMTVVACLPWSSRAAAPETTAAGRADARRGVEIPLP